MTTPISKKRRYFASGAPRRARRWAETIGRGRRITHGQWLASGRPRRKETTRRGVPIRKPLGIVWFWSPLALFLVLQGIPGSESDRRGSLISPLSSAIHGRCGMVPDCLSLGLQVAAISEFRPTGRDGDVSPSWFIMRLRELAYLISARSRRAMGRRKGGAHSAFTWLGMDFVVLICVPELTVNIVFACCWRGPDTAVREYPIQMTTGAVEAGRCRRRTWARACAAQIFSPNGRKYLPIRALGGRGRVRFWTGRLVAGLSPDVAVVGRT